MFPCVLHVLLCAKVSCIVCTLYSDVSMWLPVLLDESEDVWLPTDRNAASVTLSSSSLIPASPAEGDIVHSPDQTSSAVTSQSNVYSDSPEPLSPDSSDDYFKAEAAENVSNTSGSYQHCGSHFEPFAVTQFETPPADLVLDGDRSSAVVQDSGGSVQSNKNRGEVVSGSFSPHHKTDDYCSAAGRPSLSHMPSHLPCPAAIAVSSDGCDRKDAADFGNCSSQLCTARSTEAKSVAGRYSDLGEKELPDPDDYSPTSQTAPDSGSSEYARVELTEKGFGAELHGTPAPLSLESE